MARFDFDFPRYFTVRSFRGDRVAVFQLSGELDIYGLSKLYTAAREFVSGDRSWLPTTLLLDTSKLSFVDVAGLRAILDIRESLVADGFRVRFAFGQATRRVAALMGANLTESGGGHISPVGSAGAAGSPERIQRLTPGGSR